MPARKPNILIVRDEARITTQARINAESSARPKTVLTAATPAALRGHAKAARTWKRLIGLYLEVDGIIATAFDMDLLIKYCLIEEEVVELAAMRHTIKLEWQNSLKQAKKIKPDADNIRDWGRMWEVVNALFQRFQGMDARLDGKRKLLLAMSQSLYLTPRSRAGVAPPEKPPEKEKTEMDGLLDG